MGVGAVGIRAGKAFVELYTDDSALSRGLHQAEVKVKAFGQSITAIGSKIAGLGVAITTPFLTAAKVFADSGSALNDMSARTGVSVEALSALGYAAQQSGTDMEAVEVAIRKMQKSMVMGSEENLQAASTFEALGLSVRQLMQLNPEQQFAAITKAIARIQNPTAKAGAAMQVFGKSGTALLPMIDDLQALTKEAAAFGLVWTTEQAKRADALGDSIDLLKASFSRILAVVGDALAPLLTDLAIQLAKGAKVAIDWVKANGPLIVAAFKIGVAIAAAGAAIAALGIVIFSVGAAIGAVATIVGGLAAALTVLLNPGGLIIEVFVKFAAILGGLLNPLSLLIIGLAGLTAWFLTSTQAGHQAIASLGDGFNSLKETATQAFKGISDALKAGDIRLAGQILWAGLKVEFVKGLNFIRDLWSTWGVAVVEVVRGVQFKVASLMVDAWAGIQKAMVGGIAAAKDIWTGFTIALRNIWSGLVDSIVDIWNGVIKVIRLGVVEATRYARIVVAVAKGPIGLGREIEGINADAAGKKKKIEDEAAPEAEARAKRDLDNKNADAQAIVDREKAKKDALAEIEKGRLGSQDALAGNQQAETDNRRDAANREIADRAKQLADAQAELGKLTGKAAMEAGAIKNPELGKGPKPFTPEGLDASLHKAKVDVAGTFSASAASGLGAGQSVQDEQLKEQKKQTAQLEKLNKKANTGKLVFQ